MRKCIVILFSILAGVTPSIIAQTDSVDVSHYRFCIGLSDSNHVLTGKASLTFQLKYPSGHVSFDLNGYNDSTGKGMKVAEVLEGGKPLFFHQSPERVYIDFPQTLPAYEVVTVEIIYSGVPVDGLIISRNKFHDRTFFADNWPYRAHDWIPCDDQPSDKATVEFIVTAPDHYQVVSNGMLEETTNLPGGMTLTHWKEDLPIPTKVMVIGVAPFAVEQLGKVDQVPVSTWVFQENRDSGFAQYAISRKILPFYIHYIGPYPYEKLANVQSKTIFGGMENAGNIYYYENSVQNTPELSKDYQPLEPLFAHETAHQWFGDEVTESAYSDLWLSEGFATYMTHLYMEHAYGEDTLRSRMAHDRKVVIAFSKTHLIAVVDTTKKVDPMELLNPNSYQKGGWVLHMLRRKLGDGVFQKGIRKYYQAYKGKNASTLDFMKIMEEVSGENLHPFFAQWIYRPGLPDLRGTWSYEPGKREVKVSIDQVQGALFDFPLQIKLLGKENQSLGKTLFVSRRNTRESFPVEFKPDSLVVDPEVNLLYEGNIRNSNAIRRTR